MSDSCLVASDDLDANAFRVERAPVAPDLSLAFVHEGIGGTPLLLIHGYPETKRIWWRNIRFLADAGFEVIAPDLRGFGDSDLATDGFYDIAAFSIDLHALVHDVLGHERCVVAGGDVGGPVLYDLSLRYPGFVTRQCYFNTLAPSLDERYAAAGIPLDVPQSERTTADYFRRQATDADSLLAELDTPQRRRAYIADMYGHRLWAGMGAFTAAEIDFMTEPFEDPQKLRASWGVYEGAFGHRELSELPRLFETNPVPTLVLYGPEDNVVPRTFPDRCAVAFTECIGPFWVPGAGHFVQWEAAGVLNRALTAFLLPHD
jgi:pimeloyl-ACP methyl ester carboxylesterase